MATADVESQPIQDQNDTDLEMRSEDEEHEPGQKSTVGNDPFKLDQTRKFVNGALVHMPIRRDGRRTKGIFTIYKARLGPAGAYVEYQLVDADGLLHEKGKWIRERELNPEKKR